jgi:ATP-dependent Clp protease ATP-binding subunit ClpA
LANEILFGALRKGGVVKVTVGKKDDGKDGLILESIAEAAPIRPKPEAEVEEAEDEANALDSKISDVKPSKAKAAKKKADGDDEVLIEEPEKPRKSSTVPRVPKKK